MVEPVRLSRGHVGAAELVWQPNPDAEAVTRAAHEYLQHLIARRLHAAGHGPAHVARVAGGTEASWRAKLSGQRRMTLDDLLCLLMAVDPGLTDLPPLRPNSVDDMIPPPYRPLVSHHELGRGRPHFHSPDHMSRVADLARVLDDWWVREREEGRGWAVTADVVLHQVLTHAAILSVSAEAAVHSSPELSANDASGRQAIGVSTDETAQPAQIAVAHVIEWALQATRIHLHWLGPPEGRLSATDVGAAVRSSAEVLWSQPRDSECETKIVIVAGARQVAATLRDGLGLTASATSDWTVVDLRHAERLRLEAASRRPDLHLRLLRSSSIADWYIVK